MTISRAFGNTGFNWIKKRRLRILAGLFLLVVSCLAGGLLVYLDSDAKGAPYHYMKVAPGAVVPKLSYFTNIYLEPGSGAISAIEFSPNSQLVAIGYSRPKIGQSIKVFDLVLGKELSTFKCPEKDYSCFISAVIFGTPAFFWSNDSKSIFLATGYRWDAITGQELTAYSIKGTVGRLNRDRTKFLTVFDVIQNLNYIDVYNISDWSSTKISADGFRLKNAVWTSEDNIILSVSPLKESIGKTIDGFQIANWYDVGFILIDPETGKWIKSIWFPAIRGISANQPPWRPSVFPGIIANNFKYSLGLLGRGKLIDDKKLEIRNYYLSEEIVNSETYPGSGGHAFSPDGKYLFLKDAGWFDGRAPVTNVVIDTVEGREVAEFGGELGTGHEGIAISPDGSMMALGNDSSVQILSVDTK